MCRHENLNTFCFARIFFLSPKKLGAARARGKRGGNTNEGVKGKKDRTTSDDAGGKSVSEKSKSRDENVYDEDGAARHRAIWTNSWALVPHPWISTRPLSKGKPRFKPTCKSNRCPTTQTL